MSFEWNRIKAAVVVGAGHGIGLEFARNILETTEARVFATYRKKERASDLLSLAQSNPRLQASCIDPARQNEVKSFFSSIAIEQLDVCINAVGLLHDDSIQPEKRLEDIEADHLAKYFAVNSTPTVLIARYAKPFLKNKNPAVFCSVSAKVGSISDNRLGGWYGYRASKAALNMLLQNIAIEFERFHCHTKVLSLHPGTTVTELSKPFIARTKYQLHEPSQTAKNLMEVIANASDVGSAQFLSWDGSPIPW